MNENEYMNESLHHRTQFLPFLIIELTLPQCHCPWVHFLINLLGTLSSHGIGS